MFFSGSLLLRSLLRGCLAGVALCGTAYAAVPANYESVIQKARDGQSAVAAEKLNAWLAADPENSRILYDLATILSMDRQDEAALQYYPRIVHDDAPPYAIKAMAESARRAGHHADAEKAYRLVLEKTPDDAEAHAGFAYVWMQRGRTEEALKYIEQHLPSRPSDYAHRDLPLVVALAEAHEQRQDWLAAADAYQEALRLEPGFRYAMRGQVFALNHARLSPLAKRMAEESPEIFSDEERRQLEQDAAARLIIFGQAQAAVNEGQRRFATTDVALDANRDLVSRTGDLPVTQYDRLVALRDRVRMREAAELYESMREANVPPYAKAAAADAYLYLEQPEKARDLYLQALAQNRDASSDDILNWKIGLVSAYSEAEQHDEAEALATQLKAGTPPLIYPRVSGIEAPNIEYSQVSETSARTRLYAGRLNEAERQLAELRSRAPFNAGVRAAWASLLAARDQPRAALDEFTTLQVDEPESVDARVGQGEMLLALNSSEEARQVLKPLVQNYPENKAVQNFARMVNYRDGLTLELETTLGKGESTAGAESVLDAKLYSAPLHDSLGESYRVFTHVSTSEGDVRDSSSHSRTRIGAGLDYRVRDLILEGEINHAVSNPDINGLVLALTWSLSDSWHTDVFVDTNVNDLAAVAFQNGVTAKRVGASLRWIYNESRSAGLTLSHSKYSDDNIRDTAQVWWNERWYAGPVFRFDTTIDFSTSTNSHSDSVYFSPSRDKELSVALKGEWLTWRRYHRSFSQRVTATVGSYWQDSYGVGSLGDLRYEHVWSDDGHASLNYGIGYGFHPYDGEREYRRYGFLGLNWQIK